MLSIGEFARYGEVSVRMLRHYAALGLLVPAYVDPATGYRSYTADQLGRLNRLIALKSLGLSLEQVGEILNAELGIRELRALLQTRRVELAEQIAADTARLVEVERRLRSIEKEGTMSTAEFIEKFVPTQRVAQLSRTVADPAEIGAWLDEAFGKLLKDSRRSPADEVPAMATYAEAPEGGLVVTAAFPTDGDVWSDPSVPVGDLPEIPRALTVIHHGDMTTVRDSWEALMRRTEELGLTPAGPCREVYISAPLDRPSEWVTELQQPVR